MRRKTKTLLPSLLRWVGLVLAAFVLISGASVLVLRWVDPPMSAVMLQHWIEGAWAGGAGPYVRHEWADRERIPQDVGLAVIAAEDQRFPEHQGFDLVEIRNALEHFESGGRLRGASTISQQTAKNLFLWSGRDYIRKGLEVWFTFLIETLWTKERILEIYLNVAQFGPDTYGVGAASWRYFDRPVQALSSRDAALLAAVLPNPVLYRLDHPSAHVLRRATWIRRQMRNLGRSYLKRLEDE